MYPRKRSYMSGAEKRKQKKLKEEKLILQPASLKVTNFFKKVDSGGDHEDPGPNEADRKEEERADETENSEIGDGDTQAFILPSTSQQSIEPSPAAFVNIRETKIIHPDLPQSLPSQKPVNVIEVVNNCADAKNFDSIDPNCLTTDETFNNAWNKLPGFHVGDESSIQSEENMEDTVVSSNIEASSHNMDTEGNSNDNGQVPVGVIDEKESDTIAGAGEDDSVKLNFVKENLLPNDPVNYYRIGNFNSALLKKFLTLGACQPRAKDMPHGNFPTDTRISRHKFSENYYDVKMPDGTFTRRKWLSYSPAINRVFCMSCVLFGTPTTRSIKLARCGSDSWTNMKRILEAHEIMKEHIDCEVKKSIFLVATQRVDTQLLRVRNNDVCQNREFVKVVVRIIYYLAKHNIAFRGSVENVKNIGKANCGNFLDLVLLASKFHPTVANFLSSFGEKEKRSLTFLSSTTQNKILSIVAEKIRSGILKEIKEAKYFSVIIDTTTDVSKKDQFSLVIRYSRVNEENNEPEVVERLVALDECENASGEGMFKLFTDLCEKHDIDWRNNLVGQGYDGAASMQGPYSGLRTIIQKENKKAIYVWCFAHVLNLVIVEACSCAEDIDNFFGTVQKFVNFINIARKRVQIFKEIQEEDKKDGKLPKGDERIRSLPSFSKTRWTSHHRTTNCIQNRYDQLLKSFEKICKTDTAREVRAEAKIYFEYIQTFQFILTLLIVNDIFDITTPVSKILQSKNIDFIEAYSFVTHAIEELEKMRSEEYFGKLLERARNFAESRDLETTFPEKRRGRKKMMSGELARDERLQTEENRFRVESYYLILDTIISKMKERFSSNLRGILEECAMLKEDRMTNLFKDDNPALTEKKSSLFISLREWLNMDITATELETEFKSFSLLLPNLKKSSSSNFTPHHWQDSEISESSDDSEMSDAENGDEKCPLSVLNVFKLLGKFDLKSSFPNVYIIYRIVSTLPTSSASAERVFSVVKLIKLRIRSTMREDRLEHLMLIRCEGSIEPNEEFLESVIDQLGDSKNFSSSLRVL